MGGLEEAGAAPEGPEEGGATRKGLREGDAAQEGLEEGHSNQQGLEGAGDELEVLEEAPRAAPRIVVQRIVAFAGGLRRSDVRVGVAGRGKRQKRCRTGKGDIYFF